MKHTHYERIGRTVEVEAAMKACLKKIRYDTKTIARDQAVYIAKVHPDRPKLRPYRCTLCGHFHLTSSVKTKGGKIGKKRPMP